MSESRSQKTEKPTGKLSEARQRGNVPRTKELSSAMVLGSFLLFCHLFGPDWLQRMQGVLVYCFSNFITGDLHAAQWLALVDTMGSTTAQLLLLPVGMMGVASIGGHLLQGAPPFTVKPFKPDLSKLNPFKGIKKVLNLRSLVTLSKALLNLTLFTTIAVLAVRDAMIEGLPGAPGVEGALASLFFVINKVLFRVVMLWFLLAIADLLFNRYDYIRGLKMTKQEVKDERKQLEGDPRIKSRIRSKQLEMARARMMADVPKATVVITNPTRFAVALRYVPGEMDVPQVLAKGQELLAQRIREIAVEHRIPIVQDATLARALYRSVAVGSFIPAALFRAVAEVLALVLRGEQRHRAARRPTDEGRA